MILRKVMPNLIMMTVLVLSISCSENKSQEGTSSKHDTKVEQPQPINELRISIISTEEIVVGGDTILISDREEYFNRLLEHNEPKSIWIRGVFFESSNKVDYPFADSLKTLILEEIDAYITYDAPLDPDKTLDQESWAVILPNSVGVLAGIFSGMYRNIDWDAKVEFYVKAEDCNDCPPDPVQRNHLIDENLNCWKLDRRLTKEEFTFLDELLEPLDTYIDVEERTEIQDHPCASIAIVHRSHKNDSQLIISFDEGYIWSSPLAVAQLSELGGKRLRSWLVKETS